MINLPFNISISLDFSWIENLGSMPFYKLFWHFFLNGGFFIFIIVIIWGLFEIYVFRKQKKFGAKQNYIFLAIDIPKINLQSPKAMENFFATLSGAHMPLEWEEKIFEGKYQLGFSFEIISIDGFIQFVVRTPIHWRDLVEAALYAIYPDAEITEVEDYTKDLDIKFPSDEYNMWGTDLVLVKDFAYPIKTYVDFEHPMSKELKDPLFSLLEVMNKLNPGEQFWFQILVYPTDPGWNKLGENTLKKVLGKDVPVKKSALDKALEAPINILNEFSSQLLGLGPATEEKKDREMFFLTPEIKEKAEGVVRKLSKMAFECKPRIIYLAKKEVFNKGRGVSATFGAFKQLAQLNLNAFKPDSNKTQARWPWFKNSRLYAKQNEIFNEYKVRGDQTATSRKKCYLNIEELATLFHFPYIETYAPKIKKIESKKGKAPVDLPDVGIGLPVEDSISVEKTEAEEKVPVIDYDDDYFENRFAKDKSRKSDKLRKKQVLQKLKQDKKFQEKIVQPEEEDVEQSVQEVELENRFAKNAPVKEQASEQKNSKENNNFNPPANLPFAD